MNPNEIERLRALTQNAREAFEWARAVIEQRDEFIRDLVDGEGYTQREVAATAGLSKSRIVAIMANASIDTVM